MAGSPITVNQRALRVRWETTQSADNDSLVIAWTDDGVLASNGGSAADLGTSGDWSGFVWASIDDAAADATPVTELVVTVSGGEMTILVDRGVLTPAHGTFYFAVINDGSGPWVHGDLYVEQGSAS